MARSFFPCILLTALVCGHGMAERVLKVGLLVSRSGLLSEWGQARPATGRWLIDQENDLPNGCLKKNGIKLELHMRDVNTSAVLVQSAAHDLVHNVGVSYMMGAEGFLGTASASIAAERDVPLCVSMDGTDGSFLHPSGDRINPNVFSTMTPSSRYFVGFYRLAARNGARRLAIIEATAPPTLRAMGSGSVDDAVDAGLEVVFLRSITYGNPATATPAEEASKIGAFFSELIAAKPDVIAFATGHACASFVNLTRQFQWRPKGAIVFDCLNNPSAVDPSFLDELRGVFVPNQWHHELIGRQYSDEPNRDFARHFPYAPARGNNLPSAAQMYNTMHKVFAEATPPAKWHSLVSTDISCYYALFSAACQSNSTEPSQLRLGTHATLLPTFAGTLAFDRLGLNPVREIVTLQLKWNPDPLAAGEVAPIADTSYVPFWGLPTFAELREDTQFMGRSFEVAVLIIYALEVALLLVVIGFVLYLRKTRTIRAMSVPLSLTHLVGVLTVLQAVLTFGYTSTAMGCRARWVVLTVGVTASTVPISLKLFRISRIFYRRLLHQMIVTNGQLLFTLASACGAALAIMLVLVGIEDKTTIERFMPNIMDRSTWYYECSYGLPVEIVAAIICFSQMAVAFGLAIYARDVPHTYSAAFGTILAVYTDLILAVLFAALPDFMASHEATTSLRLALLLLYPFANVITIYIHPLRAAWRGVNLHSQWDREEQTVLGESGSGGVSGGNFISMPTAGSAEPVRKSTLYVYGPASAVTGARTSTPARDTPVATAAWSPPAEAPVKAKTSSVEAVAAPALAVEEV